VLAAERVHDRLARLRVFPHVDRLAAGLRPFDTQLLVGNHRSRAVGDGIEFASVRAFVHGDSVRRVNWRVTTRRGRLHVNEHHLERNADVVLFLDTFADAGPPGQSSLDRSVRGAAALARDALARKDRVGLVGFGGTVSWLRAGMGRAQLLRLLLGLLDVNIALSYAWKDVSVLPRRALPPGALVVAFSPLVDERALAVLADLRARGYALVVIDTLDERQVEATPGAEGEVAHRLWRFARAEGRAELAAVGAAVTSYVDGEDVSAALARLPRRPPPRARVGV
jgi:uncharacterized protein (DUF58 family)